jgi:hypothetical protein
MSVARKEEAMPKRQQRQSGRQRQKRIERTQHRPEQNAGYDEAVRGRPPVKLDVTDTIAIAHQASRGDRRFDGAAREAANDVRRRERSAR